MSFSSLGRMTTRRSMSWATVDQHSGERLAKTCRRLKIPIREYLCSIVPDLANFPSIVSQSSRPRPGQIGLGFAGFRFPPRERQLLKRFFVGTDYLFLLVCI